MADPGIWNQEIPEDVTNLAANFQKSFPNSYDFAKTFVQTPSSVAGGGNGVTSLDDPTYLGFNLLFDRSSALFNGALVGSPSIPAPQDPNDFSGGDSNSMLTEYNGSAVGYLNRQGETTLATYLKAFCQGLKEIESKRPYYFQTIEGLQEAWNKTVNMTPYGGSAEGEGIQIGMLEAIDLKMSALFNLYKLACYDNKYRRNRIPVNLMYFNVDIQIVEIRKFKRVRNWISSLNPNSPNKEMDKFVNENASMITLRFTDCLWDPTVSGTTFANVSNDGSNSMATAAMKWSYAKVEVLSQFSGYDSSLKDTAETKTLGDLAKGMGKKFLDKQMVGVENLVQRKVFGALQNLKFGNAFGLRNDIINTIQNPQGLVSSLQGALVQEETTPGLSSNISDNIFGDEASTVGGSGQTLETSNNFGDSPEQTPFNGGTLFSPQPSGPPLNSTNIFE
tara:strand:+ start:4115 stop:5458 length:1344 start_codon:yes stop_codon:yes gene_type:complete